MEILSKYLAREYVLTIIIVALVSYLPRLYKIEQVSDTVTMTVLFILVAIGASYGIVNVRKAKLALEEAGEDLSTKTPEVK